MAKKKATEMVEELSEMEIVEVKEIEANKKRLNKEELISTGCTELDIALSNTTYGGILTGKLYHYVGASKSGKTMSLLHTSAYIVSDEKYDDYDLIWDEPEDGNEIDMVEMFGPVTASRIKAPKYDENGLPVASDTVEQFYDDIMRRLDECEKTGKKFFYFLDSMDALSSDADVEKVYENMNLREKGKEVKGSYGMSKASVNSKRLGLIRNRCKKLDCTLFIISQDRTKVSPMAMPGSRTNSGGDSIKFYSDVQVWFKHDKEEEAQISYVKRPIANRALVSITKNRLTGQCHKRVPLYISYVYGIDNIIPLIERLQREKVWFGTKKAVDTKGFCEDKMSIEDLSNWVDENDKDEELVEIVHQQHMAVQEKIKSKFNRKKKFK